ncbi:MAG: hypothetical protein PUK59_00220 [Actinomycetaceae bacterium]|nr:hypothetical protein [Actinomycetaceae bacterium]MDY5854260.1 hypothetical protein [Arcanobacterium sp.]
MRPIQLALDIKTRLLDKALWTPAPVLGRNRCTIWVRVRTSALTHGGSTHEYDGIRTHALPPLQRTNNQTIQ